MHIYFCGIGGVGIGPLAMLALDAGYKVSGSNKDQSEIAKQLELRGVAVDYLQDGQNITKVNEPLLPIDWFVYSSAVSEDNPEYIYAKNNGIKMSKRDEFLKVILAEKDLQLIAVAGTHGKTTTTAMLVWIFNQLDKRISYSIGTSISFGPSAQYQVGSRYFIYECDEFDRNFLSFQPQVSIITSVDYDHPDTYPTILDYKNAFRQFLSQSSEVYIWDNAASYLELGPNNKHKVSTSSTNISTLNLAGLHNRRNAWLASLVASKLLPDVDIAIIHDILNKFPGTSRRFEQLSENIYSDYAHHPIEIAATIQLAKEINQNIVVVYQPHQNIRQHEILKEGAYTHCFEGTSAVYWLPTYLSREDANLEVLSPTELMVSTSPETKTEYKEMNESLWQTILSHQKRGDLVLCMSAGDLDTWLREKIKLQLAPQ